MSSHAQTASPVQAGAVKCVVWDLDDTLWQGVLLEEKEVGLRPRIQEVLRTLDARGILQSIASRNEPEHARQQLERFGVWEFFLHPQIGWGSKSASIQRIAEQLNIGIDSIAFVDDSPFELAEVAHELPKVRCVDARDYESLLERPEFRPPFITQDTQLRRRMYIEDMQRQQHEERFEGPKEDFLKTLDMRLAIFDAAREDLERAHELTQRTHQLNSTGITYGYEELEQLMRSERHSLLMCSLDDRFGSYGRVGLMLLERNPEGWVLRLLLMSCRVMNRGVGSVLLNFVMSSARARGVELRADFIPTDRNRPMAIAYAFAGFREVQSANGVQVLRADLSRVQGLPPYLTLDTSGAAL
uniref:FkbH-like protein n=1 Tax=Myxococcus virescens TaxID=83456 RepID=A0A0N6WAJ0_9BACT|nr:fkbH-like protein [Myxococcus virescens]